MGFYVMKEIDYSALSAEELHALCGNNNASALAELAKRYLPLVKSRALYWSAGEGEYDDLVQEAYLGFLSAVSSFDGSVGVSFGYFAKMCVDRALLNYKKSLLKSNAHQSVPLNDGLQAAGLDPEALAILRDDCANANKEALEKLSAFEYEVMSYYIGGYKIKEISDILSVSSKSVDNAVRRFKQKLRNDGQN